MYDILKGLTVIEATSFVASPSAGLYLAQFGAEVIKVDHVKGGPDFGRWPKTDEGASFYWEGLNKGKKSVALDLKSTEGREVLKQLAVSGGENGGILLTNFPESSFLAYENLRELREDVIVARVMGQANGGPAVDYTVNCALGLPSMTGPSSLGDEPVNHVLPAWDLLAGAYTAFSILAAERYRRETGKGSDIRVPLTDLGIATMGNTGQIAEVLYTGDNRARHGNELYGAFGKDFLTKDNKRIILIGLTPRQWKALVSVLNIADEIKKIETEKGVTFDYDEGVRYQHSDVLYPLVAKKIAQWDMRALGEALDEKGGCWGEYQTLKDAIADPSLVGDNPMFKSMENPSGFTYPTPGSIATIKTEQRQTPAVAPSLGAHSEEILKRLLNLKTEDLNTLQADGSIGRT